MPRRPKTKAFGHTQEDLKAIQPVNAQFRHDENGKAICGAINRKGTECRNAPMENGRCKYHGGLTPKGPNHPNFIHGRYSKYLPESMSIIVDDMMTSPDHLNQREQIAILDALLVENLREVHVGGGGEIWDQLKKLKDDYIRAQNRKRPADMVVIVNEVMDVIESGYGRILAMREARDTIESRRRVTESERKRRIEEDEMIPVDRVVVLLTRIGDTIQRHVSEEDSRRAIVDEIRQSLGGFTMREYQTYAKSENYEVIDAE